MSATNSEVGYKIHSLRPADDIAAFEETAEFVKDLVDNSEDGRNIIHLAPDLPDTDSARLTVARSPEGELAGCVVTTLAPYGAPVWVSSLAVHPGHRGQRLGYSLIRQAMADRHEVDRLALPMLCYVRVFNGEVNHSSLRSLERNGFKALTTVPMNVDNFGDRAPHWRSEGSVDLALVAWMPGEITMAPAQAHTAARLAATPGAGVLSGKPRELMASVDELRRARAHSVKRPSARAVGQPLRLTHGVPMPLSEASYVRRLRSVARIGGTA